jgi:prepilin-type N-terminal cleavage/methylation domain-containing protein
MRNKGFTLIEAIIVMAVLTILAAVYIESSGNITNVSLDAASKKAQMDVRFAQQLAQVTGTNHGVRFVANTSYTVYSGNVNNPVTDPVTRLPLIDNLSRYPGVQITTTYQVEFNPRGVPVTGGGGSTRFTAASGAIRDINVAANTGAVELDSTP